MSPTELSSEDNVSAKAISNDTHRKEHDDVKHDVSEDAHRNLVPPGAPEPILPEPSHDYRPRGKPVKPISSSGGPPKRPR